MLRIELRIIVLLTTSLLLLVMACKKPTNLIEKQSISSKLVQADSLLSANPDSSYVISNQLLGIIIQADFSDTTVAKVVDIYSKATSKLFNKDTVYKRMIQLKEEAEVANNESVTYQALIWLAQAFVDDGKFFMARKYAEDALVLAPRISDPYHKARGYNMYGSLLGFVGELEEAQEHLIKAYKLFDQNGDFKALSAVYINMANNYISMSEVNKAFEYYYKAGHTSLKHHDTLNYLVSLSNLGRLHTQSNPDSAYYYFAKALRFVDKKWMIESLATRFEYANFLVEQKLIDSANAIYQDILTICKQNKIDGGVYRAMSGLGNVLEARGLDEQALEMYQQAHRLAAKAGETPLVIDLMNAELYMYEKMGNYKQSYKLLRRIKSMSDSLFSLEKQLSIHDLELFYQNEKANLKNQELQFNMREMENRNFTIKVFLTVAIGGLIALAAFLFVFYRLYHQRDVAYTALFEKYKFDTTVLPYEVTKVEPIEKKPIEESYINSLTLEIEAYFANSKPYLNQSLKVEDVAKELGVTQKQVSAALKASYGMHFNVFVNKFRIQEALKLLSSPNYQNIKIEHIAKEVGFGSKVSFYNAFAQVTGSKPSDYRIF